MLHIDGRLSGSYKTILASPATPASDPAALTPGPARSEVSCGQGSRLPRLHQHVRLRIHADDRSHPASQSQTHLTSTAPKIQNDVTVTELKRVSDRVDHFRWISASIFRFWLKQCD